MFAFLNPTPRPHLETVQQFAQSAIAHGWFAMIVPGGPGKPQAIVTVHRAEGDTVTWTGRPARRLLNLTDAPVGISPAEWAIWKAAQGAVTEGEGMCP